MTVNPATLFQIIGLVATPAVATVIVFLMRRRPELRNLDAQSDSVLLKSATEYIAELLIDIKELRAEVRLVREEFAKVHPQLQETLTALSTARMKITSLQAIIDVLRARLRAAGLPDSEPV